MELTQIKTAVRQQMDRFDAFGPLPQVTEKELQEAQEIVAGKLQFSACGIHETVFIGRQGIDWKGGHIHHQEWPTQMGRFFMLKPLVLAYRQSPDTAYAQAARDYITDWIDHVDCTLIEQRGNTCMDISIRLGDSFNPGWTRALTTFMDAPSWDEPFIRKMLASLEKQAHVLWKRAIPSRQFGNHRIFGLDGLLYTALRLPMMADAKKMVESCRVSLEQAFRYQFMPDGSYTEQTLGYHLHMARVYGRLVKLGKHFPEVGVTISTDILVKAAEYALHTQPGGINDTSSHVIDQDIEPPRQATVRLASNMTKFTDQNIESPRQAARRTIADLTGRELPEDWYPARDIVYPNAGQVFLRSSWKNKADFLAFDASVYSGAHAHLARLGLVFRSNGRLWLADPGTFDYEMSNPFAIYGRSTAAHSTLNINGLNQSVSDAKLLRANFTEDAAVLHGVYDGGYWTGEYGWGFKSLGQGTYGRHERVIFWVRNEYLLVFDTMLCEPGLPVEHVWQMAPVKSWQHDPAQHSWTAQDPTDGFYLQMLLAPPSVEMTVYEGSNEPLRGWFNDRVDGHFTPSPQVVYRYPADTLLYPTLAMPLTAGKKPPVVRPLVSGRDRAFALDWPDGTTDVVAMALRLGTLVDEDGIFESDSPLVWARIGADGKMQRHIKYDGTFARLREGAQVR